MMHRQIPLFDRPTLNTTRIQKEVMRIAVAKSALSREQIVDKMNELADAYGIKLVNNGRLRLDTFEKWLNPNDMGRQISIRALPVFCAAINNFAAIDILARSIGHMVIGPDDQNLLKWARAYFKARDARLEMRNIEREL